MCFLKKLNYAVKVKWLVYNKRHDKVILKHDNAPPQAGKELHENAPLGSPTSPALLLPDIAHSDCYLFPWVFSFNGYRKISLFLGTNITCYNFFIEFIKLVVATILQQ